MVEEEECLIGEAAAADLIGSPVYVGSHLRCQAPVGKPC